MPRRAQWPRFSVCGCSPTQTSLLPWLEEFTRAAAAAASELPFPPRGKKRRRGARGPERGCVRACVRAWSVRGVAECSVGRTDCSKAQSVKYLNFESKLKGKRCLNELTLILGLNGLLNMFYDENDKMFYNKNV